MRATPSRTRSRWRTPEPARSTRSTWPWSTSSRPRGSTCRARSRRSSGPHARLAVRRRRPDPHRDLGRAPARTGGPPRVPGDPRRRHSTAPSTVENTATATWSSLPGIDEPTSPFNPDGRQRTGAGGVDDYSDLGHGRGPGARPVVREGAQLDVRARHGRPGGDHRRAGHLRHPGVPGRGPHHRPDDHRRGPRRALGRPGQRRGADGRRVGHATVRPGRPTSTARCPRRS